MLSFGKQRIEEREDEIRRLEHEKAEVLKRANSAYKHGEASARQIDEHWTRLLVAQYETIRRAVGAMNTANTADWSATAWNTWSPDEVL
jgi:hypothetical protein